MLPLKPSGPLWAFFIFIQSSCFPLDCKVWWWLTAPRYPSIKGLLRSFSGACWVCRCCSFINSLPYCDTGFGGWASRAHLQWRKNLSVLMFPVKSVADWLYALPGIKSALARQLLCFFLLVLLLFCFLNENGNLSVRQEWCPVSGYTFSLTCSLK